MDARQISRDPDPYARICLSLGFRVGELVVLSGHASLDDAGAFVPGDFAAQADRTLHNIERTLAAAEVGLDAVFKLNAYVTDVAAHRPILLNLIARRFGSPPPAATIVGVHMRRHPEWLVEIEALATASGRRR